MSQFSDNVWFEVECCCKCAMSFAVPADFRQRRLKDHALFYCPAGHGQHFTGKTPEQKLKDELERKEQMLSAAQSRADAAQRERDQVTKAHKRMRTRVMNGVCPCCNRTFQNLMAHMRTEHPDFTEVKTLATVRKAFAMSQSDVGREAGVKQAQVSMYERGLSVGAFARLRLDAWLERNGAMPEIVTPSVASEPESAAGNL